MSKKQILKKLLSPVLVRATKKYISKDRKVTFEGLSLSVPNGVFHPSLFFSTKTMWKFLSQKDLNGLKILEIGSGTGALSILCAQQGAQVICCDINPKAVKCTMENAASNKVNLECIKSDLFHKLKKEDFDLVIANPPFYPKNPSNLEERAWFAGENHEYFTQLFGGILPYIESKGQLLLVLSDDCNIPTINRIASEHHLDASLLFQKNNILENSYIYGYNKMG